MYSELTQQLDIHELEFLRDSLEYSASTHVQWISKINQALICHDNSAESLCTDNPPHINCQFTQWANSISKKLITNDTSFLNINNLHEQLHLKACQLILTLNKNQPILAEDYSQFTDIQFKFFKVQSALIQECNEALGIIDSLTSLPNKRAFQEILLQEENRIKRNNFTSIIAIADIDNFKKINESRGFISGDLLLIQLAELFKNSLRNFDTIARYSGDKFLLYLPETDSISAKVILERIRETIENTKFEIAADIETNITCSFGLSHIDAEISSSNSLSNAWTSLHSAKANGKNTVDTDNSE